MSVHICTYVHKNNSEQNKIKIVRFHVIIDMEDECYPAISLKTATSNVRGLSSTTIDPKCLTISSSSSMISGSSTGTGCFSSNPMVSAVSSAGSSMCSQSNSTLSSTSSISHVSNMYGNVCKISSSPITLNLRNLDSCQTLNNSITCTDANKMMVKQPATQIQQHQQQYLPQDELAEIMDNDCASSTSSRDGSQSPDICSDIEIDESCIKNEPMSPDSSCPGSPDAGDSANSNNQNGTLSLTMANMAAFTNSDLVFEHKV